jgi:hypothetical protein
MMHSQFDRQPNVGEIMICGDGSTAEQLPFLVVDGGATPTSPLQSPTPLKQGNDGGLIPYDGNHCWQYDIRCNNLDTDLQDAGMTLEYANNLRVKDFMFMPVESIAERQNLATFIKKHEWLGNLSQYTTHWFGAYHNGILAGALLFNLPNAFSKLLGEETPSLERLISRGACISWSPKNLGSAFIMYAIRWMGENTQFKLFTAYSDTTAKEIGTIYQACNFYYLGQKAGAHHRYINPYTGKIVSDRFFRVRSAYRRYAQELGYEWDKTWCSNTQMLWVNIPDEIEKQLRAQSKLRQAQSQRIIVPLKHKYAMVHGSNRKETLSLRTRFEALNKTYPYPKGR